MWPLGAFLQQYEHLFYITKVDFSKRNIKNKKPRYILIMATNICILKLNLELLSLSYYKLRNNLNWASNQIFLWYYHIHELYCYHLVPNIEKGLFVKVISEFRIRCIKISFCWINVCLSSRKSTDSLRCVGINAKKALTFSEKEFCLKPKPKELPQSLDRLEVGKYA